MKKNYLISALFLFGGLITTQAQTADTEIVFGPDLVAEATAGNFFTTGISENGRYIWGNQRTEAYYYDTETEEFCVYKCTSEERKKGYQDCKIAGITSDGIAVINYGKRICYVYDTNTGDKTYIESPLEDFPFVVAWDVTPDGNTIAGNCINKGNKQRPCVIQKQEDGSYKLTLLDYDPSDAMGAPAQFTQARVITENGKYIVGPQMSETGFSARYVTWELNDEGVYEFKTPFDSLLYDFTKEKPGIQPTYYDFVTANDKNSEEYKEQKAAYDAAFKEHRRKMKEFTKNYTNVDWAGQNTAVRGNYFCGSLKKVIGKNTGKHSPLYYDFEKQDYMVIDTLEQSTKGWNILPGNLYMSITGPEGSKDVWTVPMISVEGKQMPFHKWLEEKTGTDVADYYTSIMGDVEVGLPYFSGDGKTMVTTTWLGNEGAKSKFETSVIRFSNSIFGSVETGIENKIVSDVKFTGSKINSSSAIVDVYTFDGIKVRTFNVSGSIDLADELAKGNYIVKVREGNKTSSFKLVIG